MLDCRPKDTLLAVSKKITPFFLCAASLGTRAQTHTLFLPCPPAAGYATPHHLHRRWCPSGSAHRQLAAVQLHRGGCAAHSSSPRLSDAGGGEGGAVQEPGGAQVRRRALSWQVCCTACSCKFLAAGPGGQAVCQLLSYEHAGRGCFVRCPTARVPSSANRGQGTSSAKSPWPNVPTLQTCDAAGGRSRTTAPADGQQRRCAAGGCPSRTAAHPARGSTEPRALQLRLRPRVSRKTKQDLQQAAEKMPGHLQPLAKLLARTKLE